MQDEAVGLKELEHRALEARVLEKRALVFCIIAGLCAVVVGMGFMHEIVFSGATIFFGVIRVVLFFGFIPTLILGTIFGPFGIINGAVSFCRIKTKRALVCMIISAVAMVVFIVMWAILLNSLFVACYG